MSNKEHIISLTRRRLVASFINLFVAPFWIVLSSLLISRIFGINHINLEGFSAFIIIVIEITFSSFLYFGLFMKLTNGYTLGGLLARVKVVSLNNERLKTSTYIKRFYSALTYSHADLFEKMGTKINSIGQLHYDKKYNTTVIKSGDTIPTKKDIEEYVHSFFKEIILGLILVWIILQNLEYLIKIVF